MRSTILRILPSMVAGTAIVLLACGEVVPTPMPTSVVPTAVPHPTVVRIPTPVPVDTFAREFDLNATHTIPWLGFSIAYPEGWLAETTRGGETKISELEEDHEGLRAIFGPVLGYQVRLIRLPQLDDVSSPRSMLILFRRMLGFAEFYDPKEATVFGMKALRVTGTTGDRVADCLMAVAENGRGLVLCAGAPTEQELDIFMPTWERMLASIQRVGE